MKRTYLLIAMLAFAAVAIMAQRVTIHATREPGAVVFRSLIKQTGKNFVYSSDLLDDFEVTVNADNQPLKKVLSEIFRGTGIEYKIAGNNVMLKRKAKKQKAKKSTPAAQAPTFAAQAPEGEMLNELVVVSRLEDPVLKTPEIGAQKITAEQIMRMPAMLGENDVVKALQMQPGVSQGVDGVAAMYVHGGNADENLYMLENVPMYQVNHFGGLFSAFNPETIRYIDFFKSSFPAKYDGRLSSFMDVRLKNGAHDGHHGSFRLGLTSGSLNISGPISSKTTYFLGLRRSWFEALTIPALAIINSHDEDEKTRFRYAFTDLNAKVTHRFSDGATAFVNVYYGNDVLKTGSQDKDNSYFLWLNDEKYDYNWGNLLAQAGMNYRLSPTTTAEFTIAYTRYFSDMHYRELNQQRYGDKSETESVINTDNNVNDWIVRGDFDFTLNENSRIRYGANYVRHSFLPARTDRKYTFDQTVISTRDSSWTYGVNEVNAYVEDDWTISQALRLNIGVHASLFHIDGKTRHGISPRLSVNYHPTEQLAFKGAYSRTTQYVHQLSQSYLSLPSDQWIPITGSFKPQVADKFAIGAYWQSSNKTYNVSVETYYKSMRHLVDFCEEYYLKPSIEMWNARLTQGRGTARGIDVAVEKTCGKVTGHISYSLAWADRTFAEKNGGNTYPARFDNRHTINIVATWHANDRVEVNAAWTGHSGNRYTLMSQMWQGWAFYNVDDVYDAPLQVSLNNYQLPFYHRLDLSCTIKNRHGYWSLSLYNAYNHLNTMAVRRYYDNYGKPVFQKVKFLPIIPSISYTWQF